LLIWTTRLSRLALPLVVFLIWTPAALAWSWPVQGPVLQPFSYDPAHPYAAGQHRGVDIGAASAGETVVAPAAGTISFAGTVPTSGMSVTVQTTDGHSVTLTHLGSISVAKGATVAERDAVGTIGPSGTAEVAGPYVHLGIRVTSDPNGYVDPLGLLPPGATTGDTGGSTSSQPGSGSGSSTGSGGTSSGGSASSSPAATEPASANGDGAHESSSHAGRGGHASGRNHERAQERGSDVRPVESSSRPAAPHEDEATRTLHPPTPRQGAEAPTSSSRRPVVETSASVDPSGLDAGHEPRWSGPAAQLSPLLHRTPAVLLPLILNVAAALVALAAAALAACGRRRCRPDGFAQVLHLPRRSVDRRPASRAA
jgi:Peptidase family M23